MRFIETAKDVGELLGLLKSVNALFMYLTDSTHILLKTNHLWQ